MLANADRSARLMLKDEGGYVNDPDDPGGATNKGVTIGTLRRLGMDLDGDGDVDVADLKRLTDDDAVKVFKVFYWDAVKSDLLPSGLDYAMADFAYNGGPPRAARHLQKAVGVAQDGDIGPITLEAVRKRSVTDLIEAVCDSRLLEMTTFKHWWKYGDGWTKRVSRVRATARAWAIQPTPSARPRPPAPATGLFAALAALLRSIFGAR